MTYESHSAEETQKIAKDILRILSEQASTHATILALEGELGAGKTTFTQGLAHALGIKEQLTSPTFVILKQYEIPNNPHFKKLIHIDAYRLEDHRDLIHLGILEEMQDPATLILIEWADRVKELFTTPPVTIHFDHINETARSITINGL